MLNWIAVSNIWWINNLFAIVCRLWNDCSRCDGSWESIERFQNQIKWNAYYALFAYLFTGFSFISLDHGISAIRLYMWISVRKKNLESVSSHWHVNCSKTNEQVRIKMGHKVAYFNTNVLHNRNTFDTHFKYSIVNYFDKIDYNLKTKF